MHINTQPQFAGVRKNLYRAAKMGFCTGLVGIAGGIGFLVSSHAQAKSGQDDYQRSAVQPAQTSQTQDKPNHQSLLGALGTMGGLYLLISSGALGLATAPKPEYVESDERVSKQ